MHRRMHPIEMDRKTLLPQNLFLFRNQPCRHDYGRNMCAPLRPKNTNQQFYIHQFCVVNFQILRMRVYQNLCLRHHKLLDRTHFHLSNLYQPMFAQNHNFSFHNGAWHYPNQNHSIRIHLSLFLYRSLIFLYLSMYLMGQCDNFSHSPGLFPSMKTVFTPERLQNGGGSS